MVELSVVIPVRDEAPNVEPLGSEVHAALRGVGYEIIFVDDGSTDTTAAEVRALMSQDPRVRLLRHRRSFGQSAAVRSGVTAAAGAWIATLDGDGQNDPADLPALFDRVRSGVEPELMLVIGNRRATRRDGLIRRASSRIANAVRARLLRDDTPDTGCGFKIFNREAFLQLPAFNHMHRFLPALFQRAGATVVSVPVRHRPRLHGKSKYGVHNRLWVGLVDLFGVMWLQRRGMPPSSAVEELKIES